MLSELVVRDLAIIDEVHVSFGPGLNIVTGETGAGKSILIRALKLVLGGRGTADLVRAGRERAEVEALFTLPPALRARLADLALPDDPELVIRRTIHRNGRSRATINGHLATMAQLQGLAAGLVDISSQHEHHSLIDPRRHLHYLDAFAGHEALVAEVAAAVDEARTAREALDQLLAEARSDQLDMWRWQLQELDAADPKAGELDEIEAELARLEHGEQLHRAASDAHDALYGRDRSLCLELGRHEEGLVRAAAHDEALEVFVERMASARLELEDLASALDAYARRIDADPDRLDALRERRSALLQLCRKHACDIDGVVAKREALAARIALVDDAEHEIDRRQRRAEAALAVAGQAARRLSRARAAAADALATAITRELGDLGMGRARVEVELSVPDATDATALAYEGARLTAQGLDHAELLIAPNPGEPPRPLSRVASGGELSRSLLAIKRVLAGIGPVGLYVFDEVDTGVGGAVAESIAIKLAEVSRHHQVLCITHQAPIAAYGDEHYVVAKHVEGERTYSDIRALDDGERVEELARMLGGLVITDTTREAARELLATANPPAPLPSRSAMRAENGEDPCRASRA